MFDITKFIRRHDKKIGLPPGTPVYMGDVEEKREEIQLTVIDYDEMNVEEKTLSNVEECLAYRDTSSVTWINVDGIHDVDIIAKFRQHFDLHPLVAEDIVNPWQRPKLEDSEQYLFIVIKMLTYDENDKEIKGEQVSLILGKHYVVSFQERPGDIFDPIRERIRNGKGRIRRMGADYLAYALLDAVVDQNFVILEKLGEHIEELEEAVVTHPVPTTLQEIHKLKREMIFLRKSIWPLREVVNSLERGESSLIQKDTQRYLRDVYDHTIQIIDTVETFRDMLSGMHDTYLSGISNRMNEIMKVLTIIATIFIPLTFIAGIYGMNFEFMPELKWRWGYGTVWLMMLGVGAAMLVFFKRKKWL